MLAYLIYVMGLGKLAGSYRACNSGNALALLCSANFSSLICVKTQGASLVGCPGMAVGLGQPRHHEHNKGMLCVCL